jgi:hypothetical protein
VPLPTSQRQSRRKHVTRNWRNWHWLVRNLGVIQYLADSDGHIRAGQQGPEQVVLDCSTLCFTSPKGIDESKLGKPEEISDEMIDEIPVEDEIGEEVESEGDDGE